MHRLTVLLRRSGVAGLDSLTVAIRFRDGSRWGRAVAVGSGGGSAARPAPARGGHGQGVA